MSDFLEFIKNIRESIGEDFLIFIGGAIISVPSVILTRLRYRNDRRFSTVSDDKRQKVLTAIGLLQGDLSNSQSENVIKSQYESIGMFFPRVYNELILEFICERGIPNNDSYLNCYLKSSRQMTIDKSSIKLSKSLVRRRRIESAIVIIIISFLMLGCSSLALNIAPTAKNGIDILVYILAAAMFIAWILLYIAYTADSGRLSNAKRFDAIFAPWLSEKQQEQKNHNRYIK